MIRRLSTSLPLIAAVLFGASYFAYANLDTGEDRLIPYSGHLRSNGAAVSGDMNMRFALTTSPGDALDCLVADPPGACGLWWEERANVPVSEGAFGLALGEVTALADSVFAQDALYLVIAVQDPAGADPFTRLAGSQALQAAPFANRAVAAKNFSVSSTLTVGGEADVAGALGVGGGLTVDGDAVVGDTGNPIALTTNWQNTPALSTRHAEISNDTDNYDTLMIIGNREADGTTRRVGVWDHLDVNGSLTVDSTANFSANVTGLTATTTGCAWVYDTQYESDGGGRLYYLDRMNNLVCPANKVLVDWNVDANNQNYRVAFNCCFITVQ